MLARRVGLRDGGATSGATREEVHTAMEDLVRAREAVRIPDRDGIIRFSIPRLPRSVTTKMWKREPLMRTHVRAIIS
jgi:hypothetical protein